MKRILPRTFALSLLSILLLAIVASPAAAQQPTGGVAGRALAQDGSPVPLSLVRLVQASGSGGGRSVLTDEQGAFRFENVAPGEYRLRLERIGYTATPGAAFRVAAGETAQQTVRAALQPVQLAGITASGNACYTAARLHEAPDLEALWREAQKGAEHRRNFQRQYAFRYDLNIRGTGRMRLLRDRRVNDDTTLYTHPDSAYQREQRARQRARQGWVQQGGTSIQISIPDELDLLQDNFLTTHCLQNAEQDSAGVWTLRFRPVTRRTDVNDIRGTLKIDPRTYAVREITFQYLRGGRPWARGTLGFAEVSTPYGMVRLPTRGTLYGNPGGALGVLVEDFDGVFTIGRYRDFEQVYGPE